MSHAIELGLLDAISADMLGDDQRLILADHLEEQGDVRGRYLRLGWHSTPPATVAAAGS